MYRQAERDKVVISVLDTGIGISVDEQENLFEMFTCIKDNKDLNTEGIGLGLYISKHLVSYFNGDLIVRSVKNVGTEFVFFFMLDEDSGQTS